MSQSENEWWKFPEIDLKPRATDDDNRHTTYTLWNRDVSARYVIIYLYLYFIYIHIFLFKSSDDPSPATQTSEYNKQQHQQQH